jgi:predicted nucleic acid-binding protein
VPDARRERGLLDTSVIVDLDRIDAAVLPLEAAISALSLAELAAGPHAAATVEERARRQETLQRTEAATNPIPFGLQAARAYGRLFAAAKGSGRKPRGARAVDLMIAATALAEGLPLFTRNPKDFAACADLVEIVTV